MHAMTLLFLLLAIAVVCAALLVASGRGDPLPEPVRDLAPVRVPPSGELTTEDLDRARFPVVLRGYRMADVDALVDRFREQLRPPAPEGPADEGELPPGEGDADQLVLLPVAEEAEPAPAPAPVVAEEPEPAPAPVPPGAEDAADRPPRDAE